MYACGFRIYFTPLPGFFSPLPSRYSFAIGHQVVFSLRRWASRIRTGFHVTRTTWEYASEVRFISVTGLSPSMAALIQRDSPINRICNLCEGPHTLDSASLNPISTTVVAYHVLMVWAVPLSLATTDGIETFFLFLGVLRCFTSPGWLSQPMY